MNKPNLLNICPKIAILAFFCIPSLLQAGEIIEVGNFKFDDVFKAGREDWLQMEVPITASSNSQYNPENPSYLKNVEITATLAYDNRSKSGSKDKFVVFETSATFAMLPSQEEVKMYFYLPGEVVDYYGLSKRPEYYFLGFKVDGQEITKMHSSYYSSNLNAQSVKDFQSYASSHASKTEGMLLPLQLAPWYVTQEIDAKNLPTILRKVANGGE